MSPLKAWSMMLLVGLSAELVPGVVILVDGDFKSMASVVRYQGWRDVFHDVDDIGYSVI